MQQELDRQRALEIASLPDRYCRSEWMLIGMDRDTCGRKYKARDENDKLCKKCHDRVERKKAAKARGEYWP